MPTPDLQTAVYGLQFRTKLMVVCIGIALLLIVLNMVRRGHVREQYALLWILACVVLILSAVFSNLLDRFSHLVGIFYPPAFLFLLAILLLVVLQVHFSVVVSSLREQNKTLVQELGILEHEVRALREALRPPAGPRS
jgi:hypothetical protein